MWDPRDINRDAKWGYWRFRTDAEWAEALAEIGTPRHPGVGQVEMWSDLLDVALPLVTFHRSYRFPPGILPDGEVATSVSTLRFTSGTRSGRR